MSKYNTIKVSTDDGRTDVWKAREYQFDGYAVDNRVFLIKKDGAVVAVYSLAHMVSAVIES